MNTWSRDLWNALCRAAFSCLVLDAAVTCVLSDRSVIRVRGPVWKCVAPVRVDMCGSSVLSSRSDFLYIVITNQRPIVAKRSETVITRD